MQVFEISGFTIAAKNAEEAFLHYLEIDDHVAKSLSLGLEEGESETISISVCRLQDFQIRQKSIACCNLDTGCWRCKDRGDIVHISLQEIMDEETVFPSVLAQDE